MVMDKKGFLKILESIVAVLILFGFVIAVLPEKPAPPPGIPPDLEEITNSILTGVRETPELRYCIIYPTSDRTNVECIYDYTEFITRPKTLHPWEYGIRVCTVGCNYTGADPNTDKTIGPLINASNPDIRRNLPSDKSVYIRTVTLSVEDILGSGTSEGEPNIEEANVVYLLTIFAWSKA